MISYISNRELTEMIIVSEFDGFFFHGGCVFWPRKIHFIASRIPRGQLVSDDVCRAGEVTGPIKVTTNCPQKAPWGLEPQGLGLQNR